MQKNRLVNIIKIVFVIIGTLVGAGFASGKEIYSFFFIYGIAGVVGIIISSVLIGLIIYRVFNICNKKEIDSYKKFCNNIGRARFLKGELINNVINLFLLISFFVMIAGFSSFLNQEFSINRVVGSVIILLISYFIFLKNINGLIKLNDYLIPFLIVFILFVSFKNIDFTGGLTLKTFVDLFAKSSREPSMQCGTKIVIAVIKSFLYASYNCVVLIPVLIPLRSKIKCKTDNIILATICTGIVLLLSLALFNLLLHGNSDIFKLEMPVIGVVKKSGRLLKNIYTVTIGVSILTSAISAGCAFLNNCSKGEKQFKKNLKLMLISAIFISQISFSTFVELLYPVLGLIGLVEICLLIQ